MGVLERSEGAAEASQRRASTPYNRAVALLQLLLHAYGPTTVAAWLRSRSSTNTIASHDAVELKSISERVHEPCVVIGTEAAVDLKVAEFQAKASVNVIQTADETLGTLLDVRA